MKMHIVCDDLGMLIILTGLNVGVVLNNKWTIQNIK